MFFLLLLSFVSLGFGIGIEEAIRIALEKNPTLKALEEERRTFEGMEKSATAFPNPEIRLESGYLTTDKDSSPKGKAFNLLEFDQPLPLWGVRPKAKAVISQERKVFENVALARKRELISSVYRTFYRALTKKEMLRIWEENLKISEEVEKFVQKAYSMGEVTRLELLRARREKDFALLKARLARAEYRATLEELSGLLGEDVKEVKGSLLELPSLTRVELENLPTLRAILGRIEALDRRIELERALARPWVKAGFVIEDSEEGYYGLRGALSFNLPVFYRRQGEILQHVYAKRALREHFKAQKLLLSSRLRSMETRLSVLKEELRKLESSIIPQAEEELKIALKSYQLRVITLLELSDVKRRYYELLLNRAELFGSLHEVYSEFIELGGWR